MSLAGAMGSHSVVCTLLTAYGTEEQKRRWLPLLATGENEVQTNVIARRLIARSRQLSGR
jgi:hypothetical protein